MLKIFYTAQAAKMIGVSRITLQRWLLTGKIKEPRRVKGNGVNARLWTIRDVERVRKYKAKFYRKGRGRKPKAKQ